MQGGKKLMQLAFEFASYRNFKLNKLSNSHSKFILLTEVM